VQKKKPTFFSMILLTGNFISVHVHIHEHVLVILQIVCIYVKKNDKYFFYFIVMSLWDFIQEIPFVIIHNFSLFIK